MTNRHFSRSWLSLVLAVTLSAPGAALAFSMGSAISSMPPSGPESETEVVGYAHNVPFPIATPWVVEQDSAWAVKSINFEVDQAEQANLKNQTKDTTAITKALNAETQLLYNQRKKAFAAERAAKLEDEFNPQAGYNRPIGGCSAPSVGAQAATGLLAVKGVEAAEHVDDRKYEHSITTGATALKHLVGLDKPARSPGSLFPSGGTLTSPQQAESARQYAQTVIDPRPPMVLPKKQQETASGQKYQALRHERDAQVALSQRVLDEIIADKMPTVPADGWAAQAWASMGGKGKPPGEVNGKMSKDAMLSLMVNSRFGNSQWYAHVLAGESKIGVLRDMALMQAVALRMQLERLKLQQATAAILAAQYAASVESREDPRLEQAAETAANGEEVR
ncbi:MAG: hypothetical protein ACYDHY_13110 [Acidiferrobacterales bacterium]